MARRPVILRGILERERSPRSRWQRGRERHRSRRGDRPARVARARRTARLSVGLSARRGCGNQSAATTTAPEWCRSPIAPSIANLTTMPVCATSATITRAGARQDAARPDRVVALLSRLAQGILRGEQHSAGPVAAPTLSRSSRAPGGPGDRAVRMEHALRQSIRYWRAIRQTSRTAREEDHEQADGHDRRRACAWMQDEQDGGEENPSPATINVPMKPTATPRPANSSKRRIESRRPTSERSQNRRSPNVTG